MLLVAAGMLALHRHVEFKRWISRPSASPTRISSSGRHTVRYDVVGTTIRTTLDGEEAATAFVARG